MKLTSPRLNLVIAVGAIVWYISVAVKVIPTEDITTATVLCEVSRQAELTIVDVKVLAFFGCPAQTCSCANSDLMAMAVACSCFFLTVQFQCHTCSQLHSEAVGNIPCMHVMGKCCVRF